MSRPKVVLPSTLTRIHHDGRKEEYRVHNVLGQGGFGTVYRITNSDTNEEFALKVTPLEALKKPKLMQKHKSEVEIQRKLHHPNILQSYDYFEDSKNTYIILELCPHQSIKDLLRKKGPQSEIETASILREVINGLIYLHDNRIIHRDLKLENFLIGKDGHIKIADFGLSTKLDYDDQRRFTVCGTPNYLSPEILSSSSKGHSYEVDIWAIGVCAFALLTGKPPFETRNIKLTYEHIKSCSYRFPYEMRLSFVAKDFVQSILQIKPELRPSALELSLHPFLAVADKKPAHKPQSEQQRKKFTTVFPEGKPETQTTNTNNNNNEIHINNNINSNTNSNKKSDNEPEIGEIVSVPPPKGFVPPPNPHLIPNENIRRNENIPNEIYDKHMYETAPDHCVSRFCDHSEKFGLGYLLLNGTVGACFNDSSRMIMDPHERFIQYWTSYQTPTPIILTKDDPSQKKKISILMKFAESLKKTKSMYHLPEEPFLPSTPMKHVKYWMRSDDSLLFRMDDRTIQVNFNDKLKLIIFWTTKKLMLVSNIKEPGKMVFIYDLPKLPGIDEEKRRFAIAKAMLEEMNG
ncbi:Serine/threonine-protein kinase polo [Tritrichomonas foetus]|uniref:Serine/threonine-protein kinase PLK n=1 Tax=Tritrichomonas foetus TaxID=1144522 RepID=A0A1J4JLY0_9EUKA|nr:Serine/threonine-protein kinase polo [Tritrichomonas foetus]|eukprot:OHT00103.1 Serine/threonine-protein kinase polo [Tritrichomonas foetus]